MSSQQIDKDCMSVAINAAIKARDRGDYATGAVILIDSSVVPLDGSTPPLAGSIISIAGNRVVSKGRKPYAHAELIALDKLKGTSFDHMDQYRNMTMYTTLAPCPQCWGRMLVSGIKEVVYGAEDPLSTPDFTDVPEVFKLIAPKIRRIEGPLSEECKKLFLETRKSIDILIGYN